MPVDILDTNLHEIHTSNYNDFYKVRRDKNDLPYGLCLREPLKHNCEYRGCALDIQLYPDMVNMVKDRCLTDEDMFEEGAVLEEKNGNKTIVLQVEYYEYMINCTQGQQRHYRAELSEKKQRAVKLEEFAYGPYSAIVFATKLDTQIVLIEDITRLLNPLYSTLDSALDTRDLSKYMLNLFRQGVAQADPNAVEFIINNTYNVTNIREMKYCVRSVYLNIVHDCDEYCATSALGEFHTQFDRIERDGLRCVRDLLYGHNYTYAEDGGAHTQETYSAANTTIIVMPRVGENTTTLPLNNVGAHSHVLAATVGCVLPAVVGSAMVAYVMRSNDKFAQRVRNIVADVVGAMRGMRRVSTRDTADNDTQEGNTCVIEEGTNAEEV